MSDSENQQLQEDLRQALELVRWLDERVEEMSAERSEPIAIVSMACRLPGGIATPAAFWELLREGGDAVGAFPARWKGLDLYDPDPDAEGKCYAVEGGFITDVERFDAEFFGISPREALAMDPQQRLVLETSWEALERAGMRPSRLNESATGVYLGAGTADYGPEGAGLAVCNGYLATGKSSSIISGRLAYVLGLRGPAITVDTACSSSLVTLHLACSALRARECNLALAGGVMVMPGPGIFVEFSRLRAMARSGRCKSFSEQADGATWSEGCGILVLKRLSDAQRDGDRVLAVVRGSAVNQDGRSQGLTAPNGPSQQRVIEDALAQGGLTPADIDAVEAHGTGTPLGDPIEAGALAAVFAPDREPDRPLYLGSSKSNLGHAQAAAGVAGVIKVVLSLQHELLPRTLHAEQASSRIEWQGSGLSLLQEARAWPAGERVRRAGVSSFGFGGTNAHVIIEEAPRPADARAAPVEPALPGASLPLVVSARDESGLKAQAARWADWLAAHPEVSVYDVVHTAAERREHFEQRAALNVRDLPGAVDGLRALAQDAAYPGLVRGAASAVSRGKLALLFTGQGSQRLGMGAELLAADYPGFRAAFDEAVRALDLHLPSSLRDVMFAAPGSALSGLLDQTQYTQPALFALEVALFRQWEAWGVKPSVVAGHSIGELSAAHVAGVLSLTDAAKLVCARGRLMQECQPGGAMLSLEATEAEVRAALEPFAGRVDIAGINSPRQVVVSGDADCVDMLAEHFAALGSRKRRLTVSHAFHSPHMDAMLDAFEAVARTCDFREPTIPFVSMLTGQLVRPRELGSPGYWSRQVRGTVRFADGMQALAEFGVRTCLECGPDGVLSALGSECLPEAHFVASLRRGHDEDRALSGALGALHVRGFEPDWQVVFQQRGALVDLPTYAFQRQYFWYGPAEPTTAPSAASTSSPGELALWSAVERGESEQVAELLELPASSHAALTDLMGPLSSWRRRQTADAEVGSLLYDEAWQVQPSSEPSAGLSGTWLVVGEHGDKRQQLADALSRAGAVVHTLLPSAEPSELAEQLVAFTELAGIVSLSALDETPEPATPALSRGLLQNLRLAQALVSLDLKAPLWWLTQGAVAAQKWDGVPRPQQAASWGLGRVFALEQPARWGGLVDLPEDFEAAHCDSLIRVLAAGAGEDQVAIRRGVRLVRRLERVALGPVLKPFHARETALITGGSGALAAHLARFLAEAGARHLVLASRRGADAPRARALQEELEARGTRVTLVQCDVSDRSQLAALLDQIGPELRLVAHLAGVGSSKPCHELSLEDLTTELSAKLGGAFALHELTADRELDAFVLYGSGASLWGGAGQAAYAAANAALDGLARHRRALGLPALVMHWGTWADGGMLTQEADQYFRRLGLRAMPPRLAVRGLALALASGRTSLGVFDIDWSRFAPAFCLTRERPLLLGIDEARQILEARKERVESGPFLSEVAALPLAERVKHLLGLLTAEAAAVLQVPDPASVSATRGFMELGFDSLMSLELTRRIQQRTGINVPKTLTFDSPNLDAAARWLAGQLAAEPSNASVDTAPVHAPTAASSDHEPIAIVGVGLRLPGGVDDLDGLWRMLAEGREALRELPADRFDVCTYYSDGDQTQGKTYVKHASLLDDVATFDAGFFGISPREAAPMDPQHRLLLETAWRALEHAGLKPPALRDSDTGIFVGAAPGDYGFRAPEGSEAYALTGSVPSFHAGRVAYHLGLQGPALTVDTACSSSLVALHLACTALRRAECRVALAAGVQVLANPAGFVMLSQTQALAPDGRCKTFSAAADGYGRGEGVGVLVVMRLSDALAENRRVLGVIRGVAVNHDGTSSGITAPNGTSQQKVLQAALRDAGLAPQDVDYVECHGTGTVLGDPIEVQALGAVYGEAHAGRQPLLLGALKSNIGHLESASGIAGVLKVLAAFRHQALPPSLHTQPRNPHIPWDNLSVEVVDQLSPWPRSERVRRAGVSSFGISGTNAHVILEETPAVDAESAPSQSASSLSAPLVLSGKDDDTLRSQAARWADWLEAQPELALRDAVTTAALHRVHFQERAAVLASSKAEAVDGLRRLARGESSQKLICGSVVRGEGVAVLFTGQGSQRPGMGRELYAQLPVFRMAFDEVVAALDVHLAQPLADMMSAEREHELSQSLDRTEYTQPALFALEVALYRQWQAWGVAPRALLGHSIGELSAAHVAGVLSLADACKLVCARGRLMQRCQAGGAMMSLEASEQEVRQALQGRSSSVGVIDIAAINTPRQTVISGDAEAVTAFSAEFAVLGRRSRKLVVSHAFHSAHMDSMLAEFERVAASCTFRPPQVPLISLLTGAPASDAELCSPRYWVRQVREAVQFSAGMQTLHTLGVRAFLECGPDAVLSVFAADSLTEGAQTVCVSSLRRGQDELRSLLSAAGALHVAGCELAWEALAAGGSFTELPSYAFRRDRYWVDGPRPAAAAGDPSGLAGAADAAHLFVPELASVSLPAQAVHETPVVIGQAEELALALSASAYPDLSSLLASLLPGAVPPTLLVVDAPAPGSASELTPAQFEQQTLGALALVQTWLSEPRLAASELVWVTRSSGPDAESLGELWAAPLAGLFRSVRSEHPERSLRTVHLHTEGAALDPERIRRALALRVEPELTLRADTATAPRLVLAASAPALPMIIPADGTVLITGGLGALGATLAEHLVRQHGVRHLLLISRRADKRAAEAQVHALREAGAEHVSVAACDVADHGNLELLLAQIPAERPLAAVFHLAGVVDDGLVGTQTSERFARVLAPKLKGALHLHALTEHMPLAAFVLFSSVSGVLGGPGQSSYAAANTFLDGLAAYRRRRGLVGTSLAWGLWQPSSGGMGADLSRADLARMERHGFSALPAAQGMRLLDLALSRPEPCLVPARLDLARMAEQLGDAEPAAVLRTLLQGLTAQPTATHRKESELRAVLLALPEVDRLSRLRQVLAAEAAVVLGIEQSSKLDVKKGFMELGFDSLMALEFSKRVQKCSGVSVPRTLIYDFPDLASAAGWLLGELTTAVSEVGPLQSLSRTHDQDDPIAVVGTGLRLPGGAADLDSLWRVLAEEVDTVVEIPLERFDIQACYDPDRDAESKSYVRHAALLSDVASFDAAFFGVSPREAVPMDPQHRLLLETSWQALEDAGLRADELSDSETGVFVGAAPGEYAARAAGSADAYGMTGNVPSFTAGRISYHLGLQGPTLTVDTACSSSLVAIQLACSALQRGECQVALAGGVQVLAAPGAFVALSRTQALSPSGRSKAFSADADGYGRGEGVGMLVLMRLSEAQASKRRILGVIRGAAVNHDGKSSGITAPNGTSQQKVLKAALRHAGLEPEQVDYVECHGTGTVLGDPIEIQALGAVYGRAREAVGPLLLGAVKSNLGHLESAAGVAGILKVLAAFRHEALPASLHSQPRNPHIPWEDLAVEVVDGLRSWKRGDRVRRAGISSFGISGTNAHIILEEPPATFEDSPAVEGLSAPSSTRVPLLLSAKEPASLREQAERWARWLSMNPETPLLDVARSAAQHRSHFEHRAMLSARDVGEARTLLESLAADASAPNLVRGTADEDSRLAVLFTGQGSQRAQMGKALYSAYPLFRSALDELAEALNPHLSQDLRAVMFAESGSELSALLDQTLFTQPALFALEVALFRQWEAWGVRASCLLGHSIGELSAAFVAGVFSLADAARIVCARGRLMQACPSGGLMVSLDASEAEVLGAMRALETQQVDIAGINGPHQIVVSGDAQAVRTLAEEFARQGRRTRKLSVSHAFHSAHLDGMLEEYGRLVSGCALNPPRIPIISLLTGAAARAEDLTSPDYWVRQVREPVRFLDGMRTLQAEGVRLCLECGPDGTLSALGADCVGEDDAVRFVTSLRKGQDETGSLVNAQGGLYTAGQALAWSAILGAAATPVALPTYAFQRQRYWLDVTRPRTDLSAVGLSLVGHPLLGAMTALADGDGHVFSGRLAPREVAWLAEHKVHGAVVFPGTGTLELSLCAARALGSESIEELTLFEPIVLSGEVATQLQISEAVAAGSDQRTLTIYSRPEDGSGAWQRNAVATLGKAPPATRDSQPFAELRDWDLTDFTELDLSQFYPELGAAGLEFGATFQGLKRLWRSGSKAFGHVQLPADVKEVDPYTLHPALLDAALHTLNAALSSSEQQSVLLPFAWSEIELFATGARELRVSVVVERSADGEHASAVLHLADAAGEPVLRVGRLSLRPARAEQIRGSQRSSPHLYAVTAQPLGEVELDPTLTFAVVGGDGKLAQAFGTRAYPSLAALEATLARGMATPRVLVIDATSGAASKRDEAQALVEVHAQTSETGHSLELLQELLNSEALESVGVLWVTRGAASSGDPNDDVTDLVQAPLWGLIRSARSEQAGRSLRLLDLDHGRPPRDELLRALVAVHEPELFLRHDKLQAPRLAPSRAFKDALELPAEAAFRLTLSERGRLDTLAFEALSSHGELADHEVRVEVRAGGLNFRDVLNALGMVHAPQLGLECAGIVRAVGPKVRHLTVGRRVMGLCAGAFASEVHTDARLLTPIPDSLSFAQAAAIPLAYLTALHAFTDLGAVKRGDRVLVHAAAGGVGMAAVALARQLGAEVFATASPGKWDVLRNLGLDDAHIASSRDTSFATKWGGSTGGHGMDVILNSLAGEYVDASLGLLRSGGRFLEMGKTDIRDPEQVRAAHPGVTYRAFDLIDAGPDHLAVLLAKLHELLAVGALPPLPMISYDVRHAPSAFRFMAQARHVGKIVLTTPRRIEPDGTFLLTGGTGELGQALAEYLVRNHGVKHLVLTSRRGNEAAGASALTARLHDLGADSVRVVSCDVASRSDLARVLADIPAAHPLTGVVHLAGVLDDGVVTKQTPERFSRVLAPKVLGASHLHALTAQLDLPVFVLFSSTSGVFGAAGQSNYAAANTFLDALAVHRRRRGLAATSLSWGLWAQSGVGMTAHLGRTELARMERHGFFAMPVAEGMKLFDLALERPEAGLVPVRLDLTRMQKQLGEQEPPALLRGLLRSSLRRAASSDRRQRPSDLRERLAALSESERLAALIELVQAEVAIVLGLAGPQAVDKTKELQKLGLDSLMAVELRNRLAALVGASLPSTLAFDYPTATALGGLVLEKLAVGSHGSAAPTVARRSVTRQDIELFAELLLTASPEQIASHGLAGGLFKLRDELLQKQPQRRAELTEDDELEHADRDELMSFLEQRIGADS